jgi:hypothetical protein
MRVFHFSDKGSTLPPDLKWGQTHVATLNIKNKPKIHVTVIR